METTLIINTLEQANGTLTLQGRSLVTPRSKALKAFGKGVMWITYAQVGYLSTVIESAK